MNRNMATLWYNYDQPVMILGSYAPGPAGSAWVAMPSTALFARGFPSFTMDPDGTILAVSSSIVGSRYDAFFRVHTPGSGWTAQAQIPANDADVTEIKVQFDRFGSAAAIWSQGPNTWVSRYE